MSNDFDNPCLGPALDNLHRKGWLERDLDGRAYRYRPVWSRQEYGAELMRQALAGSGDQVGTLLRFVQDVSPAEADAIRQTLAGRDSQGRKARDKR